MFVLLQDLLGRGQLVTAALQQILTCYHANRERRMAKF